MPEKSRRNNHARVISPLIHLEISAAGQRDLDFDEDFAILDEGNGNFFNFDVLFTVEDGCCHLSVHFCLSVPG